MKQLNYREIAAVALDKMEHGGVFFTVKDKTGRINTMNIGWGSLSFYWAMPVFIAPIRHNRYTYDLLQNADSYTVSIPLDDSMKKALAFVGTHHGCDVDKYAAAHITPAPAMAVDGAIISQCALHIECKIRLVQPMNAPALDEGVNARMYKDNDYHTFYFGEIVACYRTDE